MIRLVIIFIFLFIWIQLALAEKMRLVAAAESGWWGCGAIGTYRGHPTATKTELAAYLRF